MASFVHVEMLFLLVFFGVAISIHHCAEPPQPPPTTAPGSTPATATKPTSTPNKLQKQTKTTTQAANDEDDQLMESPDPEYENDAYTESIKIITTTDLLHEHLAMLYKQINQQQDTDRVPTDNDPAFNPLIFGLDVSATDPDKQSSEGLTPDEIEANQIYTSALKKMHRGRAEWNTAKKTFQELAQKRHLKASAQYAWMVLLSKPTADSTENVRVLLSELAKNGLPEAHSALGYMYATGIGMNVSQARAVVHYSIGAMGDDPMSQMALGYRFWTGVSVPANCERALNFYKRVALKVNIIRIYNWHRVSS